MRMRVPDKKTVPVRFSYPVIYLLKKQEEKTMNFLNGNIKPIYLKYLAAALILFFKPTKRFASLFMQLSFIRSVDTFLQGYQCLSYRVQRFMISSPLDHRRKPSSAEQILLLFQ